MVCFSKFRISVSEQSCKAEQKEIRIVNVFLIDLHMHSASILFEIRLRP